MSGEVFGTQSPCVGCVHNTKRDGKIRRDGAVQCRLDDSGEVLLASNSQQNFELREPLPPGTSCFLRAQVGQRLMAERRKRLGQVRQDNDDIQSSEETSSSGSG